MHLERLNFFLFFLHPCGTPTSLGLWLFPGGAMEGLKCTTSQLWEPAIHLQINPSDHLPKKPASLSCLPLLSKWPSICSAKPLKLILAPPLFFSLPTSNLPAMVLRCAFKYIQHLTTSHCLQAVAQLLGAELRPKNRLLSFRSVFPSPHPRASLIWMGNLGPSPAQLHLPRAPGPPSTTCTRKSFAESQPLF